MDLQELVDRSWAIRQAYHNLEVKFLFQCVGYFIIVASPCFVITSRRKFPISLDKAKRSSSTVHLES